MGWKAFKNEFGVTHPIHILHDAQMLCIGTTKSTRIAYICMKTGHVVECEPENFLAENYPNILKASPSKRLKFIKIKDRFYKHDRVYSFDFQKGRVVTHKCEKTGFFRTTHEGDLMLKGVHFARKYDAVERARVELESRIEWGQDEIDRKTSDLKAAESRLLEHKSALMKLVQPKSTVVTRA